MNFNHLGPAQGCGGILQTSSGTITSLDIDNNNVYENNLDCRYYLAVEANKIVQMNFTGGFDVETSPSGDCSYDYVEVCGTNRNFINESALNANAPQSTNVVCAFVILCKLLFFFTLEDF